MEEEAFFQSGKQDGEKFRDGNGQPIRYCVPLLNLIDSERVATFLLLATVVQYKRVTGGKMIRHMYFSHYRGIREGITASITVGTAVLLGYFILQAGV